MIDTPDLRSGNTASSIHSNSNSSEDEIYDIVRNRLQKQQNGGSKQYKSPQKKNKVLDPALSVSKASLTSNSTAFQSAEEGYDEDIVELPRADIEKTPETHGRHEASQYLEGNVIVNDTPIVGTSYFEMMGDSLVTPKAMMASLKSPSPRNNRWKNFPHKGFDRTPLQDTPLREATNANEQSTSSELNRQLAGLGISSALVSERENATKVNEDDDELIAITDPDDVDSINLAPLEGNKKVNGDNSKDIVNSQIFRNRGSPSPAVSRSSTPNMLATQNRIFFEDRNRKLPQTYRQTSLGRGPSLQNLAEHTFADSSFMYDSKDTDILDSANDIMSVDNNRIKTDSRSNSVLTNDSKSSNDFKLENQDLSYLFITAVHSFDNNSLQNNDDVNICLSFEKGDVAFVHSIDRSGWGEVTLVKNEQRGWVPFNYFSDTIKSKTSMKPTENQLKIMLYTRSPLSDLLEASAKYLLHPKDISLGKPGETTFDVNYINAIRDGVKSLLEKTGCVSRSTELVKAKPLVKRVRKKLLADWYHLMLKADQYKHTHKDKHITKLISLVYKVLQRSFRFYEVWDVNVREYERDKRASAEKKVKMEQNRRFTPTKSIASPLSFRSSRSIVSPASSRSSQSSSDMLPYLPSPPHAMVRLNDIHDVFYSYIGLILGRFDMIEFNQKGCETLEFMAHQIIILLRELLYISRSCSNKLREEYQNAYEETLEKSLNPLLRNVSELVSCVKSIVTESIENNVRDSNELSIASSDIYYSKYSADLLNIASHMAVMVTNCINGCNKYLQLLGDFQLGGDREYLDFKQVQLSPDDFIRKCFATTVKEIIKNKYLTNQVEEFETSEDLNTNKDLTMFSRIRCNTTDPLSFTQYGMRYLGDIIAERLSAYDEHWQRIKLNNNGLDMLGVNDSVNNYGLIQEEIMLNREGSMIGASFRALIYKLTDELDKPNDFFTATILINFRTFGNVNEMLDLLITRFDLNNQYIDEDINQNNGPYASKTSRIKSRRKLICNIIQIWMESYWNFSIDNQILPCLINFFNEGISEYLPTESKELIELAAKIIATSHYNQDPKQQNRNTSTINQLFPKMIKHTRTNSIVSDVSSIDSDSSLKSTGFSFDDRIINKYELTHIYEYDGEKVPTSVTSMNIGQSTFLSKTNIEDIEIIVKKYRAISGLRVNSFKNKNADDNNIISRENTKILLEDWNKLTLNKSIYPDELIIIKGSISDLNPLEVAKQITLIESQLLMNVQINELIDENYTTKNIKLNKAPNVNSIINFTNQLSNYVMDSILKNDISMKERSSRVNIWLKIALSTLYFRNFNSVCAIMIAIQNPAISRLKEIWNNLNDKNQELHDFLARIVHPSHNYKVYRKKLRHLMEEYFPGNIQLSKSPLPVVPFFNLFLQDFTFINDGNADYRNSEIVNLPKIINIEKYFQLTKTINVIEFFQVGYDIPSTNKENKKTTTIETSNESNLDTKCIQPIPILQEFILYELWRVNTLFSQESDRAYQLSLEIVPRNF